MTCFWDGLINNLTDDNYKMININYKLTIENFINILKSKNKITKDITWNNNILNQKELEENKQSIDNYDIKDYTNGYLCSTCDPFLLLYSDIFCVNIIHKYNGNDMIYVNINNKTLSYKKFESLLFALNYYNCNCNNKEHYRRPYNSYNSYNSINNSYTTIDYIVYIFLFIICPIIVYFYYHSDNKKLNIKK